MIWSLLLLAAPVAAQPAELSFDEPLVELSPLVPRTEQDDQRAASAALYAASRLHQQRQEHQAALRRLQRAWRNAPENRALLSEIVQLALEVRRMDEAVRFATLGERHPALDPIVLRRLALHASSRQQLRPALQLYERALLASDTAADGDLELGDALLYFDMGRIAFLLGDYQKASDCLARIQHLLEDPRRMSDNATLQKMLVAQTERTYLLLAESYWASGRYEQAAEAYRKANEASPDDALLEYRLARIDARQGRDEQAFQRLEHYLEAAAERPERQALELLAELYGRLRGERAEQDLLAHLESLGQSPEAGPELLLFLGDRQRARQCWEQAERWYRRAVKARPEAAGFAGLAEVYRRQASPEELLEALGQASAAGFLLEDLGEIGQQLPADDPLVETLIAAARQRLQTDEPAAAVTGIPMAAADLAVSSGRYDAAEQFFATALQWKEPEVRARALLSWGVDLLLADQYARAAALYRRGVEGQLAGDREDLCHYYLVRSLALAGEHDQAQRAAEAAAAAFPDALRLQTLPAWVLYHAQRYEQALPRYEALLTRYDDVHDNALVRDEMRDARSSLSSLCVHLGRLEQAEEWLEQVLDEFPGDIGALNDLGYLWADQGKQLQRALQMIQRAVDAEPENLAYLDSLGWVQFRLQNYPQAVRWLEKAASGESVDGVILDHLGDAYWQAGQRDKALAAWRKAVQEFEQDAEASKGGATAAKIRKHESCKK